MENQRDTLPWRAGWVINPPAGSQPPDTPCRPGFRLGAAPGTLTPLAAAPAWRLVAEPSHGARCLAHGFVLADAAGAGRHHVYCTQPGTLCGEADESAEIRLDSDRFEVRRDDGQSVISVDGLCVALVVARHEGVLRWALVWSDGNEHETVVHAKAALVAGAKACWDGLVAARRGLLARAQCDDALRPAVVEAVEILLGSLRPADGAIPGAWLDTRHTTPAMDLGRAIAILPALAMLSPRDALALFHTLLQLREPDGSLPARVAPNEDHALDHAPLPLLADAARALWRNATSLDFLRNAVPRLATVLGRQLDHFTSPASGAPCWRHAAESLTPEIHDEGLATPDAGAILLSELDALAELAAPYPDFAGIVNPLLARRPALEETVRAYFWDSETSSFRGRYSDGRAIRRTTVAGVMTMLSSAAEPGHVESLARSIAPGGPLRLPRGIASWARWESDETQPAVAPLVQILVLRALRRQGLDAAADTLARDLSAGIARLHAQNAALPAMLAGSRDDGDLPFETAALTIHLAFGDVLAARAARRRVSPVMGWLDRQRNGLAAAAILAALGAAVLLSWPSLSGFGGNAAPDIRVGEARLLYDAGDYHAAIQAYELLRNSPVRDAQQIDFKLGNAWFHLGGYAQAEAAYRVALDRNPDQPRAWMNLALSLFKQGRFAPARELYSEFVATFGDLYPELADRARTAMALCEQQERTAP